MDREPIASIKDIQSLLVAGFTAWKTLGHVSISERGDLRLFNYTAQAQYEARWNYLERVSRGLILNARTGEVVARPFDKFFNWGEGERTTAAPVSVVTEKLDGSLGILYRENGGYRLATRGSFESEQAIWGTEFLQQNHDLSGFLNDVTLLFEIIYPENRVVVDYEGREDLVLLAVRNRFTGRYYPWATVQNIAHTFGFGLPQVSQFTAPEQLISASETLTSNSEGWVVEFSDGQRFKFKGEEYRKLHKLISGLSFKNTLAAIVDGTLDELREIVPDEFLGEVNEWVAEIQNTVVETKEQVEDAFAQAPQGNRKAFALWVMANHKPLAPHLFARLDERPLEPLIYKLAFQERQKASRHAAPLAAEA